MEANPGTSACVCEGGSPLALCSTSPVLGAGGWAPEEETLLGDPRGVAWLSCLAPAPSVQWAPRLLWAAQQATHSSWAGLGGTDHRQHI